MFNHENEELLDPSISPDSLENPGGHIRKLNKKPIIIAGGGIVTFLMVIFVAASVKPKEHPAQSNSKISHAANEALSLLDGHPAYGTIPAAPPPAPPTPPVPVSAPTPVSAPAPAPSNPDTPPVPPRLEQNQSAPPPAVPVAPTPSLEDENLVRAEQSMNEIKLSQFQEGLKGHSSVQLHMPETHEDQEHDDSSNGKGLSDKTDEKAVHDDDDDDTSKKKQGDNYSEYDGNGSDRWKLTSEIENPTHYMLRTGSVIPATLISGINSELPGLINAQVSQNVYDTATGRYLLIPQGSRLVGAYNNQVAYGQHRILIAWQRIVFPDGKAMDIGAMPGASFDGYSGLKDVVDNHFLRIFGSALLMSGITAGINYTQNQQQGNNYGYNQNSSSVISQSLGQGLGQAMIQMFQKNLNIAPTLKIRPGFVLNVMVSKDVRFPKPYHDFDYR